MASKFSEFLASKKLDPRRIMAVSTDLEKLRPADRALRLAKRLSKKDGGKPMAADAPKRRAGKTVPGAAKTRVLRAVNALLESKKSEAAQLKDLF